MTSRAKNMEMTTVEGNGFVILSWSTSGIGSRFISASNRLVFIAKFRKSFKLCFLPQSAAFPCIYVTLWV